MSAMSRRFLVLLLLCCVVGATCLSCTSSTTPGTTGGGSGGDGDLITLQGAGASFPFPIYDRWFKEFGEKNPDIRINYQSVGSGAGVTQFTEKLVDFGASDAAMSDEEIAKVEAGVQLLPMTAGAIVLAYNVLEIEEPLKLSRDAYTGIFLGKITKWNDPAIAAANPDVALPDSPIHVIRRSDGSGTTYVFTNHLSEINEEWKSGPGVHKSPNWPGETVGAKGNEGVTASLAQTPGSIGYIEYGYAKQANLKMASLENNSGKFVAPNTQSAQAALAGGEMPENLRLWLPDPAGEDAYPIVTYTWLLAYKKYEDPAKAAALKKAVEYCITDGQAISEEMGYIPLPENVVAVVKQAVETIE
jgi:phosphate transport system substrate-binding protein